MANDRAHRSLHRRPGIGLTANVVQYTDLRFSRIAVDRPALILLKNGVKTLQSGGQRWKMHSGDAIALAAGQTFDVANQMSPAGLFEARWIVWDGAVLERHQQRATPTRTTARAEILRSVGTEFVDAIDRAVRAVHDIATVPDEVAAHRLTEVLVWLSSLDVNFAATGADSIAFKLRRLFGSSLGEPWTMPAVAHRLAMSEATLRRRLAAEGASFSTLLADVRMSAAMTLLQSTQHAVAEIAATVGYESASRFAVRFRERFGFPPTAIRGHRR